MADIEKKNRVIGILHTLRELKSADLVDEDSMYPVDAVADIQTRLLDRAQSWYKVGARRGANEVLQAFIDGRLTIIRRRDGIVEIVSYVEEVKWRRKLRVSVGNARKSVRATTYKISFSDLGFK